MVEFIYVSYMFDSLLVRVKLNHDVMEQDFQHCTIFKLNYIHLGLCMPFRCEMSGGSHAEDSSVHIC
jgi:hypothetical protein